MFLVGLCEMIRASDVDVFQVRSSEHAAAGRARRLQRGPETSQHHRRLSQGPRHLHQTVCSVCSMKL